VGKARLAAVAVYVWEVEPQHIGQAGTKQVFKKCPTDEKQKTLGKMMFGKIIEIK
jgi:hypothetical protein